MKKFLIILLALVLAVFAVGCNIGTFTPPIDKTEPNTPDTPVGPGNSDNPPDDGDDPDDPLTGDDGYTFTVTLIEYNADGEPEPFYPPATMTLYAQWIGTDGAHNAKIQYNGVASIRLNGDYRVSLSGLPDSYTYNPNGLEVDNNNRDAFIEMLPVTTYNSANGQLGNGEYNCIRLNKLGTYKVELNKNQQIWFQYYPTSGGKFVVESIADAMANEVNPKLTWNSGNAVYYNKYTVKTVDDGGYEGSYTKNFKLQTELGDENVGSVIWLCLEASQIGDNYPVSFYFTVYYGGKAAPQKIVEATGPYYNGHHPTEEGGTWRWSYRDNAYGSRYYTDGTYGTEEIKEGEAGYESAFRWNGKRYRYQPDARFKLWWTDSNGNGVYDEEDEGDGFYHYYDPERWPNGSTDVTGTYPAGYGPLVWAVIGGWDEIYQRTVQYENGSADVDNLRNRAATTTVSYIPFIEAYATVKSDYTDSGYHVSLFSSHLTGYDEIIHPVNAELKDALNKLALSLGYYNDGAGNAENVGQYYANASNIIVSSGPDSMWLIFCGYFTYNYNVGD